MLYYLFKSLIPFESGFNLFTYITFRSALAALCAFLMSVVLGPYFIEKMRALKVGQRIRKEEAPSLHELHQNKAGTPTMGGLLIVGAVVISTFLWAKALSSLVWVALICIVYLAGVGFIDDYVKLRKDRSLGLRGWWKFLAQIVLGLALGLYLFHRPLNPEFGTKVDILFMSELFVDLRWLYVPFVILIVVGTSNAVNLTDGLDGLAIGSVIMAAIAYTGMSYVVGRSDFTEYLKIIHVEDGGELAVFCSAIVGAGMGFLWFNSYPAQIFMGDTGSLALGGALGATAVLIKQELLLVIVGGLFVIEALSVIVQVVSFQLTGKRVFRMSPLHHHYELKGWSETKVTVRFWIIAAIFAMLSLSTLKIR